jgi:TPR repeat protein
VCFANGAGVPVDHTEAVKWYRRAAEQGDAAAQLNLGQCFEAGLGVAKDLIEAVRWYRTAADQKLPAALQALQRLGL